MDFHECARGRAVLGLGVSSPVQKLQADATLSAEPRPLGARGRSMLALWQARPKLLHLVLFFAVYLLGCGFAELVGIVPGTNVTIWPPGGLFIATLLVAPRRTWGWWALVGLPAELGAQLLWYHSPMDASVLIYLGNAMEAVTGAWLISR